jgi:hypothetical protein
MLAFGFIASTRQSPGAVAVDRGGGRTHRLHEVKPSTDAAKTFTAQSQAVNAEVVEPLIEPRAFILEAQAQRAGEAGAEIRRLVTTHGAPALGYLSSSGEVDGKIDTTPLPDGKQSYPLIPHSFSAARDEHRRMLREGILTLHGKDRVRLLESTLPAKAAAFAEMLAEARPTLEAAVELLGGKPSEKGAFLDAQVAMEDGMGRYGATSAKVATWREDLERALPHLERLMADVLGHHLGGKLDADGRFGLAGNTATGSEGLMGMARRAGPERRDQAIRFVLSLVKEQGIQVRAGKRQHFDLPACTAEAVLLLDTHLQPERRSEQGQQKFRAELR